MVPDQPELDQLHSPVLIRVDTFIKLRWLAILGQTNAVIIVAFGLGYDMPWALCLGLIAVTAALNVVLSGRFSGRHRLPGERIFSLLAFDIIQLGLLLFLTGGLQNPFSILLMAPVIVSSTSLRLKHTLILGGLAAIITTLQVFFYLPLPWRPGEAFQLPLVYVFGVWVAFMCTLGFTAIYAFRVAEEARKLANALTATELVLQREQHLKALDGLAAAAAHELGTPLATIALVSKEMMNAIPADNAMRDDAELLRSQATRCREILQKLTSLSSDDERIIQTQSLKALVEEVVAPLRDFGVMISVNHTGDGPAPKTRRNAAIEYGLGNLLDNAVDFANEQVSVKTSWSTDLVSIRITDDGPGFPADLVGRLGEPFVSAREKTDEVHSTRDHGLGLGLFIAKTLLERGGAVLDFSNSSAGHGACAIVSWPREQFETL